MKYLLRWWWSDGSGSGVLPRVFSEEERDLVLMVLETLDPNQRWEFVAVVK